jgi:SAM-dependent methyltransferase
MIKINNLRNVKIINDFGQGFLKFLRTIYSITFKVRGLDFTSPVFINELRFTNKEYIAFNSTFPARLLVKTLKKLNITPQDAIIDLGSGKGYTLFLCTKFPFKKIVGIEISEKLYSISRINLDTLNIKKIELINIDALDFKHYHLFNYYILGNPFIGDTFEKVISNILNDFGPYNEKYIIYFHPRCHDILMKKNAQLIFRFKTILDRDLHVYRITKQFVRENIVAS